MSLRAGIVIGCAAFAASAPTASAATLKVVVDPTTVHRNQTYVITITGHYRHRADPGTPHLLAFIQYSGTVCRATATAEYGLPVGEWSWLFYPQRAESHAHFKNVFYEQAHTRYGNRRICAYLYATAVEPETSAKPVVRAGAPYREVSGSAPTAPSTTTASAAYRPGGWRTT